MKILITCGGTGGHIYPGIAFGRLAAKENETVFVGGINGMEEKIIKAEGFRFIPIPVGKLLRSFAFKNIVNMAGFLRGIFAALNVLKRERPDVIIGFGGYVSAPMVLAGKLRRIPVALHEQNAVPGLTNRLLSKLARRVFAGFPGAEKEFGAKGIYTGNPVREEIGGTAREAARRALNIAAGNKVVSVIGGSQGARTMNVLVFEALKKLKTGSINVLWMTGEKDYAFYKEKVKELDGVKPELKQYFNNMNEIYAATDVLIARAGASTISEAVKCGIPAIYIPFPAAANNHQVYNARAVAVKGAALMYEEADLTGEKLAKEIERLLSNSLTLKENIKKLKSADSAKLMLAELKRMAGA